MYATLLPSPPNAYRKISEAVALLGSLLILIILPCVGFPLSSGIADGFFPESFPLSSGIADGFFPESFPLSSGIADGFFPESFPLLSGSADVFFFICFDAVTLVEFRRGIILIHEFPDFLLHFLYDCIILNFFVLRGIKHKIVEMASE